MKHNQPYERVNKSMPVHKIMFNNFIGGIAWALGATVGISLLFTLLALISKNVNFVPIVGEFVSQVIDFILVNNQNIKG